MSVYFAQPVGGGPIKIGCSRNVPQRLQHLQSYWGRKLILLATKPGGFTEEAETHARFAHLRLKSPNINGVQFEQFQPAPELLDYIGVACGPETDFGPVQLMLPKDWGKPPRPRRVRPAPGEPGMGPILRMNFCRLGYSDLVVRVGEVADKVTANTGKKMTKQRVSGLLNAVRATPETIETLARGLGVEVSELLRPIDVD